MQTSTEIEAQIRAKADEDEDFRGRLIQDPREAIRELTGVQVPDTFEIHIHEETDKDFHMVLPQAGKHLSNEELSGTSGGFAPTSGEY